MRIVIAPNAFKGSLSALEAADEIAEGVRAAAPDADLVLVPIADGGDGIGGSATNDGGAGMAQALGYHLLDEHGHELPPGGLALKRLARIHVGGVHANWKKADVDVACDVTNPLTGPNGASAVYGPQKGATPAMVAELDAALEHFAQIIRRDLGVDVERLPGAGAAGGLGAG